MGLQNLLARLTRGRLGSAKPAVAVLRLQGVIGSRGSRGLSLSGLAGAIDRAFAVRGLVAVALQINSPGGSPVQSSLIHQRIRQLAAEKSVPVFAFAEDVAASGGYWLALTGDEIFADETSILGSIGVVTSSFGFVEVIRKLGIERRLYTAGTSKATLDPFLEEKPDDVARLSMVQQDIHESFKDIVRRRRGERLTGADEVIFTGEIFTGRAALRHGLIDGIGDLRGTMRARFGEDIRLVPVEAERRRRWLPSIPFLSRAEPSGQFGAGIGDLVSAVEDRLFWNRFGL